ncbi:MAG: hypothetical protein A2V84_07325 [Chloroflexi bacterium RBG_16_70_13]|nr:MAG: hypothetical protein A2V84_07325 [Chloroflexi bacterium RBG_16_70_13]
MHASRATRLVASLGLGLAALWAPTAVNASCVIVEPEAWKTADVVLVGTVTSVANNDRWAQVAVEEIWRGPDQPAEVVVKGGGGDPGMITSIDRTYEVGVRYVFTLTVAGEDLTDNACSGTAIAESMDIDRIRPADARVVKAPGGGDNELDLGGLVGPLLVVAAIGGLLLTTVLVMRRREA